MVLLNRRMGPLARLDPAGRQLRGDKVKKGPMIISGFLFISVVLVSHGNLSVWLQEAMVPDSSAPFKRMRGQVPGRTRPPGPVRLPSEC